MAYNISKKFKKSNDYYSDLEIQELRKKYRGKTPPFEEISRVGTRRVSEVPLMIHQKGTFVEYKNKYGIVKKSTDKGIYIQLIKEDKDGFGYLSKETIFVPEKNVEHIFATPQIPRWIL
jgi:hypothetical protein